MSSGSARLGLGSGSGDPPPPAPRRDRALLCPYPGVFTRLGVRTSLPGPWRCGDWEEVTAAWSGAFAWGRRDPGLVLPLPSLNLVSPWPSPASDAPGAEGLLWGWDFWQDQMR